MDDDNTALNSAQSVSRVDVFMYVCALAPAGQADVRPCIYVCDCLHQLIELNWRTDAIVLLNCRILLSNDFLTFRNENVTPQRCAQYSINVRLFIPLHLRYFIIRISDINCDNYAESEQENSPGRAGSSD